MGRYPSISSTARPRRATRRPPSALAQNRFSVTRQLRYSRDETQLALDLCLFINGLPVATFELKNSLTKQTVEDAIEQYKRDRDPRETLFEFGRCVVHFAVDDHEVRFCTHLKGKASWFLPFNQGWNDGAGNPPNPDGLKTDYLWKRILTREGLTDILENYAQIVERRTRRPGKKARADLPALSPARRGAQTPGRCRPARRGQALPHPALGGQRQVQLHRLAGPSAHRPAQGRGCRSSIRSSSSPTGASSTSRSATRSSSSPRWARRSAQCRKAMARRRAAREVHRERQEDHHLHGAERSRSSSTRSATSTGEEVRHHHRRGPLQPGRTGPRRPMSDGALGGWRGRGGRDHRGQDQPHHGGAEAAAQRQLLRLHRHAQEQDAGDLRRALRRRRGRSSTGPSTATR